MGVALGLVDLGLDFYRAITDGEGEAIMMKGIQEATRKRRSG